MDELIIRYLLGQTTTEDKDRLSRWRRLDPENERAYQTTARLWDLLGEAAFTEEVGSKPSFDTLMDLARHEAPVAQPVGASVAPSRRLWTMRRVAVGLLAAGVAGLAFVQTGYRLGDGEQPPPHLLEGEVVTGVTDLTTLTLADGTSIRLGPASRLRIRRDGPDEIVELEGRAFFAVRSDATRRFRVITASGVVTVRGTRFEVRSDPDEFRVLVVDGRVEVAAAGSAVELGEASMSRVGAGRPLATVEVEDVYGQLDWMGSSLVFSHTPLPRALVEIERRLGLSVVLEDRSFEGITVTATFTDQTAEEVMLVLCEMIGTECIIADGRAVILAPVRAQRPRAP